MSRLKPLLYTLHAEIKLRERKLQRSWIERTARNPEWVGPEPGDPAAERRFHAIDDFGGRILRVVCVETETTIRIITALFDRGAERKR